MSVTFGENQHNSESSFVFTKPLVCSRALCSFGHVAVLSACVGVEMCCVLESNCVVCVDAVVMTVVMVYDLLLRWTCVEGRTNSSHVDWTFHLSHCKCDVKS